MTTDRPGASPEGAPPDPVTDIGAIAATDAAFDRIAAGDRAAGDDPALRLFASLSHDVRTTPPPAEWRAPAAGERPLRRRAAHAGRRAALASVGAVAASVLCAVGVAAATGVDPVAAVTHGRVHLAPVHSTARDRPDGAGPTAPESPTPLPTSASPNARHSPATVPHPGDNGHSGHPGDHAHPGNNGHGPHGHQPPGRTRGNGPGRNSSGHKGTGHGLGHGQGNGNGNGKHDHTPPGKAPSPGDPPSASPSGDATPSPTPTEPSAAPDQTGSGTPAP